MRDYNRITESLEVSFIKARHIKVLQALTIENFYDVENVMILLNKGKITYVQGNEKVTVLPGEILFIPGGKPTTITYGSEDPVNLNNDYFTNHRWKYFQALPRVDFEADFENFSYITFETRILDAVSFFSSLDIPAFVIKDNRKLKDALVDIIVESGSEHVGSSKIVTTSMERLVIEIMRHILDRNMFIEKLVTNINYFKDPRLIKIFNYIKDNLGGDLSNKTLATIAKISEDYVGQYFKMLTGVNPQDHVEYQRMERAVQLLRNTNQSVRDIGRTVGFKDTAYFCRRFKMMFGIPAGKMRRRETLMSF